MSLAYRLLSPPGRATLAVFAAIGRVAMFTGRALGSALRPPYYVSRLVEQMLAIGYFSLPVVGLTALFTGAALAQQIFVGGERFNAESTVPAVTVIAIVRELGPVLGGLMIASTIVLPVLVLVANVLGVLGGYAIGTQRLGFNPASYLATTRSYLEWGDVLSSLVKAAVFGFIIAMMGCYHGFNSGGGAAGVGRSTTNAVVSAFVLILLANLIITVLVFGT